MLHVRNRLDIGPRMLLSKIACVRAGAELVRSYPCIGGNG
jgi:hypothetical protein